MRRLISLFPSKVSLSLSFSFLVLPFLFIDVFAQDGFYTKAEVRAGTNINSLAGGFSVGTDVASYRATILDGASGFFWGDSYSYVNFGILSTTLAAISEQGNYPIQYVSGEGRVSSSVTVYGPEGTGTVRYVTRLLLVREGGSSYFQDANGLLHNGRPMAYSNIVSEVSPTDKLILNISDPQPIVFGEPFDVTAELSTSVDGCYVYIQSFASQTFVFGCKIYDSLGQEVTNNYKVATGVGNCHMSFIGEDLAPSDYDGNGTSDLGIYNFADGCWYIKSLEGDVPVWAQQWGWSGAVPVAGDYNGDATNDLAVYDNDTGAWYIKSSSGSVIAWDDVWGRKGAVPVPGDYDGDGADDFAVFDNDSGSWFVRSLSGYVIESGNKWGWAGAIPVPGDYDGDGIDDFAVYDANTGNWYVKSTFGSVILWAKQWGWAGATPVPGDYDGDRVNDLAVFNKATGDWYIQSVSGSVILWGDKWGWPGATPVPGDFDGNGMHDLAVFDSSKGDWYIRSVSGSVITWAHRWGWSGANAVGGIE